MAKKSKTQAPPGNTTAERFDSYPPAEYVEIRSDSALTVIVYGPVYRRHPGGREVPITHPMIFDAAQRIRSSLVGTNVTVLIDDKGFVIRVRGCWMTPSEHADMVKRLARPTHLGRAYVRANQVVFNKKPRAAIVRVFVDEGTYQAVAAGSKFDGVKRWKLLREPSGRMVVVAYVEYAGQEGKEVICRAADSICDALKVALRSPVLISPDWVDALDLLMETLAIY